MSKIRPSQARTASLFLGATAVFGCSARGQSGIAITDQYAVFSAVINDVIKADGFAGDPAFYEEHKPIGVIVIVGDIDPVRRITRYESEALPQLHTSTVADFQRRSTAAQLARKFAGIGEYEIVAADDLEALFKEGGWKGFYQRFPSAPGLVTFSQVGFDPSRSQAIVRVMQLRGSLSGHVDFHLLERSGGTWRVIASVRVQDI